MTFNSLTMHPLGLASCCTHQPAHTALHTVLHPRGIYTGGSCASALHLWTCKKLYRYLMWKKIMLTFEHFLKCTPERYSRVPTSRVHLLFRFLSMPMLHAIGVCTNCVRLANCVSSCFSFSVVYVCRKFWILVNSEQNYCINKSAVQNSSER